MKEKLGEIIKDENGKVMMVEKLDENINLLSEVDKRVEGFAKDIKDSINIITETIKSIEVVNKNNKKENFFSEELKTYQNEIGRGKFIFPKTSSNISDGRDHFPINTIGRAKNALARAGQTKGKAPKWFKGTYTAFRKAVISAVKRAYPSINISTKFEEMKKKKKKGKCLIDPIFQTICKLEESTKKLEENKDKVVEIEMIRSGLFSHPFYGDMFWTKEKFNTLRKNFKKNVVGREVSIDFNHNNRDIAAGWIKDLNVKPNGKGGHSLYGKIDLTEDGYSALSKKLYKYFSIEWNDEYKDKEVAKDGNRKSYGPTLLGGGLTNRPYIDKLSPILVQNNGEKTEQKFKKVA